MGRCEEPRFVDFGLFTRKNCLLLFRRAKFHFDVQKVPSKMSRAESFQNLPKNVKGQQLLEPNHTHFLLLDDGTYYNYDTKDYRTRLVEKISSHENRHSEQNFDVRFEKRKMNCFCSSSSLCDDRRRRWSWHVGRDLQRSFKRNSHCFDRCSFERAEENSLKFISSCGEFGFLG